VAWWGPVRLSSVVLLTLAPVLVGCAGEEGSGQKTAQEGHRSRQTTMGEFEQTNQQQEEPMAFGSTSMMTAESAEGGVLAGETAGQSEGSAERTDEESGLLLSDTLVSGVRDLTGGPLTEHRLGSYYGHPLSGAMGILGQLEPEAMVEQLKKQAEVYTKIDPERSAIPTIELIASVAQPTPGPDGLYLNRTEPRFIEAPWSLGHALCRFH